MELTSIVSPQVEAPARLSLAQKRDLLGQAVAAVVTTALIAAPLLVPPAGSVDVSSETTLPAQSFAGVAAAISIEAPAPSVARARRARTSARAVAADGPLMARAIPVMAMIPYSAGTSGRDTAARTMGRKPLSRKLTGWLTGDGTHTVRPFPTVASRQN